MSPAPPGEFAVVVFFKLRRIGEPGVKAEGQAPKKDIQCKQRWRSDMASVNKCFVARLAVMIWACIAVLVGLPWFVPTLALLGLVMFSLGIQQDGRPSKSSLAIVGVSVALGLVSFILNV